MGLPQGSSLSCCLFLAAINSLVDELSSCTEQVFGFADDIAFITRSRISMQRALLVVDHWCSRFTMTLNKSKSAILVIRKDKRTPAAAYEAVNGIPVKTVYKYLGVCFKDNGSCETHVQALKLKCDDSLSKLSPLIDKIADVRTKTVLTKSLAISRSSYALALLTPAKKSNMDLAWKLKGAEAHIKMFAVNSVYTS